MKKLILIFTLFLVFMPTASANDWCDENPDAPECGDLTEPIIPIIGPGCNSDHEWSCFSNRMFLPVVGV